MTADLLIEIEVTHPAGYAEYKNLAPAAAALDGGKYIARGGKTATLEGDWQPRRLVILEFPSFEQAAAWPSSPEYAPAQAMRHACATSRMVVIEGV